MQRLRDRRREGIRLIETARYDDHQDDRDEGEEPEVDREDGEPSGEWRASSESADQRFDHSSLCALLAAEKYALTLFEPIRLGVVRRTRAR